jgi:hypothetical protein
LILLLYYLYDICKFNESHTYSGKNLQYNYITLNIHLPQVKANTDQMPVSVHSMFGSPTSEVPTAQDTSADVTEPSDDNSIEPF